MKNGFDNSGLGFGNDSETVNLTSGQVITIEGKEYTVIENVEGNQYKVLATNTFQKAFDGNSINYATSTIANYLNNNYYNSLPETIRNAIVETPIQQTKLNNYTNVNPTDWGEKNDAGTHKVFIPSWDEIIKVYGTTPDTLKAYAPKDFTWLRDTYDNSVLNVTSFGILYLDDTHRSHYVRPAFVLDLSKVEYTIK